MSPGPGDWADLATVAAFRAGWSFVRRLPEPAAYRLFDGIADVVRRRGGADVARMRSNYARVRPDAGPAELDRLVRAGLRSYFRYWCEAFRLPDYTPDRLREQVRAENDGFVRAEFAAGRPVVAFLGHLGNWDLAGAWSGVALAPVTTVAERLEPEALFLEFLAFRERLGMTVLPLTGGGDVFAALLAATAGPRLVPLLADRDLTSRGIEVDLAGHRARVAAGPAALALARGAALVPITTRYEPRPPGDRRSGGHRLVVTFYDPVPDPGRGERADRVLLMTQGCVDAIGAAVAARPEDWHMMQAVFVDDLDPARLPARTD
ncbi:phosphatidylinositol mannoside acyltransferase [Agilicoccus flavus]|uniref:phosphatidylinositol mannoside acyltransferase n=1 Tax=Agilicoccus flavus TaxID=2775968 RepID=UPI001CF716DD|nr:phosphatidylinositol mannoside acyltransferase [Agilicoccus flavus]